MIVHEVTVYSWVIGILRVYNPESQLRLTVAIIVLGILRTYNVNSKQDSLRFGIFASN